MQRRSFLSLLITTAAVPALAKLKTLAPAPPPALPRPRLPLIQSGGLANVQRYVMSFAPDAGFDFVIPAGRITRLVCMPQLPFRPDRLMVQHLDQQFQILGMSIGGEPQLDTVLEDEYVDADIFAPTSFGAHLHFETAAPGQTIVMAVRNCGSRAQPFQAALIGSGFQRKPTPFPVEFSGPAVPPPDDDDDDDD